MTVEFVCEKCQKDNLTHPLRDGNSIVCPECSNEVAVALSKGMQAGGKVDRCLICDRIRFYVQKDFNPRLGILIFVLGVLFSYHTKFISLFVATAIDFILYKVLNTVTICHHCRAIYRGFQEDPTHRGFDHNLAMSLVELEERQNQAATEEPTGVS